MTFSPATEIRFDDEPVIDLRDQVHYDVTLSTGDRILIEGANAYQPEGPMTTFFHNASAKSTLDSWSVRIASYRTADIASIQRATAHAGITSAASPRHVADVVTSNQSEWADDEHGRPALIAA